MIYTTYHRRKIAREKAMEKEKKWEETAKRLRKALDDKNMKAIELAEKSGINRGTISQYLSGRYTPANNNAKKMAAVLDVSPMWLMGFDMVIVEDEKHDKKEKLGYYFTLLTKVDQDKLLEYAEFLLSKYED